MSLGVFSAKKEERMKVVLKSGDAGSATLSACGAYRYRLTRHWGTGGKRVAWIMANPSTADHETNDPTITRCIGFSKMIGATSLAVSNLFAYRATNPKELIKVPDPIGPDNVAILGEATLGCDIVIAAWGALSDKLWAKARPSIEIVKRFSHLKCLGKTKSGAPRHPLYLPSNRQLESWP